MDPIETEKRAKKLHQLLETFGKQLSPGAFAMYLKAIDDIPSKEFDEAIDKASKQCRFMPPPAEFRDLAIGMPLLPRAEEINAAERARWGEGRH